MSEPAVALGWTRAARVLLTVVGAAILLAGCDGSDLGPAAEPREALTAENAEWLPVALPRSPESLLSMAHDGTDFYLLTSSQGSPGLMRSADGLDWEEIPVPVIAPGDHLRHVAATSQILVLVGSESLPGGGTTAIVFTTFERGPWIRSELPVDEIDPPGRPFNVSTSVETVAVTESGFALAGSHGPVSRPRPMLWTSRDGIDWIVAFDSAPPLAFEYVSYATTGVVEAVLTQTEFGGVVWLRSGDGWTRPSPAASLEALAALNDGLYVAGTDLETGAPGIWATRDGVNWERRSTPRHGIGEFSSSPGGIVAIGWEDAGGSAEAVIEVGDLTLRALRNGRFQVVAADGETVVEVFGEDIVQGDPLAILDPETGEVLVEFDRRRLEQAWQRAFQAAPAPEKYSLLISQDGDTWAAVPPADPLFEPFLGVYGTDAVLVSGWTELGGPELFLVRAGS